jgi:hypothetical protein
MLGDRIEIINFQLKKIMNDEPIIMNYNRMASSKKLIVLLLFFY